MSERDILILLSTYNGAPYVEAQLASLQRQTLAHRIHLLIRDDASNDQTIATIKALDLTPLSVELTSGPNLGAAGSFAALAQSAPTDFPTIMFCDQDDVWLPDKVAVAAQTLADTDQAIPTLYCSRSTIVDADLAEIGLTADAPRGPSLRNALFQNIAPGHTMAFNAALLAHFRATINDRAIMHDWWAYLLAAGLGKVIFDPTPHALYRLHAANEIGYQTTRLQRLTKDLRRLINEDRSALTRQAQALAETIGDQLPAENRALLTAFLNQTRLSDRLAYLRAYPMIAQTRRRPWASSLLFLLGRYRSALA